MSSSQGRTAEGAPPPRRHRLVFSLLGVLALVGLVPLASFAFKLIQTSRKALETSQQEIELQLASSIAGQIDSYMDGLARQLSAIGDSFGAAMGEQGTRRFEASLEERSVLAGFLDERLVVLRFTPLGSETHEAFVGEGPPPPDVGRLFDREAEQLQRSPRAIGSGLPQVSDPALVGPGRFAAVVVTVPVLSGGSLHGILQGLVSIDGLWARVARREAAGHEIYALDAHGRLFAHTDPREMASPGGFKDLEIVQKFLASQQRSKET